MAQPDPELRGAIIAYLRKHHPDIWRHWFDQVDPVGTFGSTVHLLVREPVQLRYLQRCCTRQFTEAVQSATGCLFGVRFVSPEELDGPVTLQRGDGRSGATTGRGDGASSVQRADDLPLVPDYSFSNFILGPSNNLAYAGARAVAEHPGRVYNPFLIHGGIGLGKTHLLQAIVQSAIKSRPDVRIVYLSCNEFLELFLAAVQSSQMRDFRHRFRDADMLVIDDIHFLSRNEPSQEEFFHTFNTLQQAGKQVVLSSDAAPSEIPDLEERLVSRFGCGLVARIDRPCFETRKAILRSKAALRNLELPDDVIDLIATRRTGNIRELEGTLTQVQGIASLEGRTIDLELAREALGDAGPAVHRAPTIQDVTMTVSRYFGLRPGDLYARCKQRSIAFPRQIAMYAARRLTSMSYGDIGVHMGGRDHTTVLHACRTVEAKAKLDARLAKDIEQIERQIAAPLEAHGRGAEDRTTDRPVDRPTARSTDRVPDRSPDRVADTPSHDAGLD